MRRLSTMLLISALAVSPAHAQSLDDALALAAAHNPVVQEARLAVRAAEEDIVQARAAYLPSLDAEASYGARRTDRTQPGFSTSNGVRDLQPTTGSLLLGQSLYSGGRRDAASDFAKAGVATARAELRGAEANVYLATVAAYMDILRDEDIVRIRTRNVEGLDKALYGARRRLDVGEVSRTDVTQAEARLAGARAALIAGQAALRSSRATYESVVGEQPLALAPPPPALDLPASVEEAKTLADTYSPDIAAAREIAKQGLSRVETERATMRPQLSVVGRLDWREEEDFVDTRTESASAVAQLRMPLFEGGYKRSKFRQSRVNAQRAALSVEAQRRRVAANVASAWNDAVSAREIVIGAAEQARASREALDGVTREQGLGLRSTIDVLDAERDLLDAEVAHARAQRDAYVAAYTLAAEMGRLGFEKQQPLETDWFHGR